MIVRKNWDICSPYFDYSGLINDYLFIMINFHFQFNKIDCSEYPDLILAYAKLQTTSWKEGALLTQLRSGHSLTLGLAHYKNCGGGWVREKLARMPSLYKNTGADIFGRADLSLDVMSLQPRETLAYAERTRPSRLWRLNNNNSSSRSISGICSFGRNRRVNSRLRL